MITPVLESKRIILRPLALNDGNHIFKNWTSDLFGSSSINFKKELDCYELGFEYYADSSFTSFNGEKHFLSKDYYLIVEQFLYE